MSELRILLVEDNLGDAVLIRRALERSDSAVQVSLASTLGDGIALLAGGYDAVLLDLTLPDAHGLDTLHRMRTAAAGLPIVVLTGLDDPGIESACLAGGASSYLSKDRLDGPRLGETLRRAIARS